MRGSLRSPFAGATSPAPLLRGLLPPHPLCRGRSAPPLRGQLPPHPFCGGNFPRTPFAGDTSPAPPLRRIIPPHPLCGGYFPPHPHLRESRAGTNCRLDVCPFGRLEGGVCFAGLFIAPSAHPPSRPVGRQQHGRLVRCPFARYTHSAHPPSRPVGRQQHGRLVGCPFARYTRSAHPPSRTLGGLLLRAAYARNCFCSRSPSLHGQTWLAIFNSLPYYGRGGRGARAKGGRPHPAPVDLPHPLLCGGLLWRALYTPKRGTQYGSVKPSSAPSRACPPLRAARALRSEPSAALPRCTTALHSGHGRLSAPDTHGSTLRAAGG